MCLHAAEASAQSLTIGDFLSLREQYNEGQTLSSNSSPRRTGWELEQRFGERGNYICELWRIGSTKAASQARMVAVKNADGQWNLLYWIYDAKQAEGFEKSLSDEGYTLFSVTESSFEETKVYRRTDYDQCVKIKRLRNTARFNQSERQYIVTLGDSYCGDAANTYICTGDAHELGGSNQCHYTISGGMITGLYAVTDSIGDTLLTVNYRNGQREGVCRQYRNDGSLQETTHYKNDLLDGEQTFYDEKGRKIASTQWTMGWNTQQWPNGTKTRRFIYFNQLGRWKDSLLYHYDRDGRCTEEEHYNIKYDGTPGHHINIQYNIFHDSTGRDTILPISATYASLLPLHGYPDELAWAYYIDATIMADTLDSIAQAKLKGVSDSVMWGESRNGWTDDYSYDTLGRVLERTVRSYVEGRIECLRLNAGRSQLLQSAMFHGRTCTVRNRKGTTLAKGSVRGDRRHGKWQHFTDEKKHRVWKEEYYDNGELDSLLTQKLEYDTVSGRWRKMYLTANYSKGILNGAYELKDSAKRTLLKGEYLHGEKHGEWIEALTGDSVWLRNYTQGAKDGSQQLTVGGLIAKETRYTHNLPRQMTLYDTAGQLSQQFLFDYTKGDLICRHTSVIGDTTWIKTWRVENYEKLKDLDYDRFEELVVSSPWLVVSYSDGERLVHKTGDTTKVYARGRLLRDQHIGSWEFVDYSQEVRLTVIYDAKTGDLLRREYYTDLNGNPYSGSYWYNGGYTDNPPLPNPGETREIADGVRAHGFGSRSKQ